MTTASSARATEGLLARVGAHPVAAGVVGACCIAFSAIWVRLAEVAPATAAVFRCAYAVPVLLLLARAETRRLGPRSPGSWRFGYLAGVCFAFDLVLWHHAIDAVGAGLGTVLANLQVVVVALVAWWLLGERPSRTFPVAAGLALCGAVAISGLAGGGTYGERPLAGVAFGLGTALAYSGFLLLLRRGGTDLRRPAGPLLDATVAAALVAAVLGALSDGVDLVPSWPAHGWLVALALGSQVLGWLLISVSLPRLPAALTSLLLLVQPVGSVALGAALLGERPTAVQILGAALIVAGVLVGTRRTPQSADDESATSNSWSAEKIASA